MSSWWNLTLEVGGAEADSLAEEFESLGAIAVTLAAADDTEIHVAADGVDEAAAERWPLTRVTALLPGELDPDALLAALRERSPAWADAGPVSERFADADWIAAFRQHFAPLRVGPLGIRTSWAPAFDAGVDEIVLDPGMAFGTGAHATTRLCLQALAEAAPLTGMQVVDYGCGSGVLAIAAARLGAAGVRAVDIDPLACRVATANAAANGEAGRITVGPPDSLPGGEADLVVANILLAPLLELAPRLRGLLRPGGRLVMSGVTAAQLATLHACYAAHLEALDGREHEGWAMLSGRVPTC